jgi:hypothetical protein
MVDKDGLPSGYVKLDEKTPTDGVLSTTSFLVQADRFLLPAATFRQSVCIQDSAAAVKGAADCKSGVFVEAAYDPVLRRITYRQTTDPAAKHLVPGGTYKITVFPPPSAGSTFGVQAFDGAPLDRVYAYEFTVAKADPPGAKVEPPPSASCIALPLKQALGQCALAGCHSTSTMADHGVLLSPAEGLDLSSMDGFARTGIGHVAHESQTGEHANQGDVAPLRFGRAMPIVDPSRPGNSYMLYKLLANRHNTTTPSDEEVARLRASVIVGMPMPPVNGQNDFFDDEGLGALSTWILAGAPTKVCAK